MVAAAPAATAMWTGLAHAIRCAARLLRRQPAFASVAVLTMALGIGATTALFSVTYGVLLKPLPWPGADRLVRVSESRAGREPRIRGTITNATYVAWRAQPSTIEEVGGWRVVPATAIVGDAESTPLQTAAVPPSLFPLPRARPLRGRPLLAPAGNPRGSSPPA